MLELIAFIVVVILTGYGILSYSKNVRTRFLIAQGKVVSLSLVLSQKADVRQIILIDFGLGQETWISSAIEDVGIDHENGLLLNSKIVLPGPSRKDLRAIRKLHNCESQFFMFTDAVY